jgi:hypothetical protein
MPTALDGGECSFWFKLIRMTFMSENLKSVYQAVINGDMTAAQGGVQEAVDSGVSVAEILNSALIPAMGEVGRLFEEGEYFVPEMLIAARAMKASLEIIKPLLVDSSVEPIGKFAVGTVSGDLHDIGKNLVAIMMEGPDLKSSIWAPMSIQMILCPQPKMGQCHWTVCLADHHHAEHGGHYQCH